MNNYLVKKCMAEFIGTFALIFFGCGAMIIYELNPSLISLDSIPIIFGLIIAVMIYSLNHISGAHFNPVVSIIFYLNKSINTKELGAYITVQIMGATGASLAHKFFFGSNHSFGMTINRLTTTQGFLFEILITIFLIFTIMSVSTIKTSSKSIIGFSIGGIVAICSFIGSSANRVEIEKIKSNILLCIKITLRIESNYTSII